MRLLMVLSAFVVGQLGGAAVTVAVNTTDPDMKLWAMMIGIVLLPIAGLIVGRID